MGGGLLLLLLSLAARTSAAAGSKQCGASDAEPTYQYGDVFNPARDQGIAFSSEWVFRFEGVGGGVCVCCARLAHSLARPLFSFDQKTKPNQKTCPVSRAVSTTATTPSSRTSRACGCPDSDGERTDGDRGIVFFLSLVAPLASDVSPSSSKKQKSPPKIAATNRSQEKRRHVPPDLARAKRPLHHVPRAHAQRLGGLAPDPHHGAVSF